MRPRVVGLATRTWHAGAQRWTSSRPQSCALGWCKCFTACTLSTNNRSVSRFSSVAPVHHSTPWRQRSETVADKADLLRDLPATAVRFLYRHLRIPVAGKEQIAGHAWRSAHGPNIPTTARWRRVDWSSTNDVRPPWISQLMLHRRKLHGSKGKLVGQRCARYATSPRSPQARWKRRFARSRHIWWDGFRRCPISAFSRAGLS